MTRKVKALKSKKLAQLVVDALDDLKGESIRTINVEKLTAITDYMVIATGRSSTHIKALADAVATRAKKADVEVVGIEGKMQSEWVLVDVGDVVVHIMLAPVRALYNLEELWSFDAAVGSEHSGSSEGPAKVL
jgi:ribosome-associated protein